MIDQLPHRFLMTTSSILQLNKVVLDAIIAHDVNRNNSNHHFIADINSSNSK